MKSHLRQWFWGAVTLLGILPVSAYDFQVDGIYYTIEGDGVAVSQNNRSYSGSIVIPASVTYEGKTYSVTSIGNCAFYCCTELTSVTIPESITTIGILAFNYCPLLTSIIIPKSVTHIGRYAFLSCAKLASITIPESVTIIGGDAFSGTTWYDNQPDGVIYINRVLYKYKGTMPENTHIDIREETVSISGSAFDDCIGLTSITIPESVTMIGENAFKGTTWYDNQSDGLVYINRVLYGYKGLIPDNLHIDIQEGTLSVADCAFRDNTGLVSVMIPESVTTIGEFAFEGNPNLKEIMVSENNNSYSSLDGILYNKDKTTLLQCPGGKVSVTIPLSVINIGWFAFSRCAGLTSVTIPESITNIDGGAFYKCGGLTSITIPESVTTIGVQAFNRCTELNSVIIGSSVIRIGMESFSYCHKLTSVTMGQSVTSIGESAFEYTGLTSVTIPESVTSIGSSVFTGCDNLQNIYMLTETPPIIDPYTFRNYNAILYVPAGSKSKYMEAAYWSNFTNIQEMGAIQYTIEVVSSDESMGSVIGGGEYDEGTVVTLAAIPASGYHFVQWSDGNTNNPRQITVTEDVSLSAEFSASCKLSASSNDDTMGSVTAVLTAAPKEGYRFVQWNDGNIENPRTVFVTETIDLIAEFEAISTDITEISGKSSHIYVVDRTLHVENNEGAYQVYTAAGQLVYTGRDTTVSLIEAGVYIVLTEDRAQKVVVK